MDDPAARQRSSHVLWQLQALTRDTANRNAVMHRPGLPRMLVGLLAAEPLCQELAAGTVRRLAWRSPESAAHFAGLDAMGPLVGETCVSVPAGLCIWAHGSWWQEQPQHNGTKTSNVCVPVTVDLGIDASLWETEAAGGGHHLPEWPPRLCMGIQDVKGCELGSKAVCGCCGRGPVPQELAAESDLAQQ